jgi:hypothetical protein
MFLTVYENGETHFDSHSLAATLAYHEKIEAPKREMREKILKIGKYHRNVKVRAQYIIEGKK